VDVGHPGLSVRRQCELLGLSASSMYYHRVAVDPEDLMIMGLIDRQYLETPFYGVLRMSAWLHRQGLAVGPKRVRRLMRQMGLEAIYPKPRTTIPSAGDKRFPYLLKGLTVDHPNHVWCIDITYVGLHTGWAYLVAIMDWFSRYVLSWELSNTLETGFCLSALERAMHRRRRPEIFNSDQGCQFTSEAFVGALEQAQIKISMDGRGRAYDNIFIERLWRTVKYENIYPLEYNSMTEANMGLRNYFEFYNQERLHQSLGYQTPAEVYQARPTVGRCRGAGGSKAAPPLALRAHCGAALLPGRTLS
jgi:putative transposase